MAKRARLDFQPVVWVGVFVFFTCELVWDDRGDAPSWLVWPAFAAMLVGTSGLLVEWIMQKHRRSRTDRAAGVEGQEVGARIGSRGKDAASAARPSHALAPNRSGTLKAARRNADTRACTIHQRP